MRCCFISESDGIVYSAWKGAGGRHTDLIRSISKHTKPSRANSRGREGTQVSVYSSAWHGFDLWTLDFSAKHVSNRAAAGEKWPVVNYI